MFNVRVVLSLALFLSLCGQANEYIDESLFKLSLEELLAIEVEVASGVLESELEVGSTVSLITREQWLQRGARRTDDALSGLISTIALPTFGGGNALAIRGYATELSVRGIATILDGVPLNTLAFGTAAYDKPNLDLGILQRIETHRNHSWPGFGHLWQRCLSRGGLSQEFFQSSEYRQRRVRAGSHGV